MDEDFGFDSGFDDVGSADLEIDSGFDDSSFDTDFSMDDIGSEEIISEDFSETDLSMDVTEDYDSFEDVESAELDMTPTEDELLGETNDGLELPDESFEAEEITDFSADDGNLELDDFDGDIDTLDTEDDSSLSELDTDDFDDTFETEDVTDDTVEDEDSFVGTEGEGYFENIPNEMEPFVMEEAQAETDTDATETIPEMEEESPEELESGLEPDTFEETESPDDTVSNEPPPTEADNDTPDEGTAVEENDVPESDKTPYEAMRDYMYEHDYGQTDYPEYSQDPEWQALNEQYTASLEETPATDEIPADTTDQVWDSPESTEPQELYDGDVIDLHDEVADGTTDSEVVQDTSDKNPYEAMRDYMYEHNYGQMDYPEYSKDPEWQALNDQYTASLEETAVTEEMPAVDGFNEESDTERLIDFSDSPDDTATNVEDISESDPFDTVGAQELHDGDAVYFHDSETESIDDTMVIEDSYEESFDVPESNIESEISEVTDEVFDSVDKPIDLDQDSGIDFQDDNELADEELNSETESFNNPEEGEELSGETSEDDEAADLFSSDVSEPYDDTEGLTVEDQSGDNVSETDDYDITDVSSETEEFGTYEIPGSLSDLETADNSEIPDDVPDSPQYVREYDDFETLQLIENPEFYDTGQFYEQGINEYGFEGTCGPTSQANAINTLLGNNELTENKVLEIAVNNNLCDITDDVVNSGGTTTENFMELYDKVNESIGDKISAEVFDYDSALSVSEMAERLDEGSVLNVAVDSATLWGENDHIPGMLAENEYTDHWITVTGVDRTETGDIAGFDIIDSGGGESYVDADTYERMCFGENGREMIDPTCIVVSKKQEI